MSRPFTILRHLLTLIVTLALLPSAAVRAGTVRNGSDSEKPRLERANIVHTSAAPHATPRDEIDWRSFALADDSLQMRGTALQAVPPKHFPHEANSYVNVVIHADGFTIQLVTPVDRTTSLAPAAKSGPSRECGSHPSCLPAAP
ncbi:MAG: hypothetical protein QM770_14835 [Tepidisphaeraceae bacterium]